MSDERSEEGRPLRDEEPFATIRTRPVRFGVGIPTVFFGGIALGFPFAETNLSLAIAIQLGVQTAGFLWLYVPVARRRWRELESPGDEEVPPGD